MGGYRMKISIVMLNHGYRYRNVEAKISTQIIKYTVLKIHEYVGKRNATPRGRGFVQTVIAKKCRSYVCIKYLLLNIIALRT